jgi:transcriptional regulator with XRE-family HTH domain
VAVSPTTRAVMPLSYTVGQRVRWMLSNRGWSLMQLHKKTVELDGRHRGKHRGVSHSAISLLTRGKVAYPEARTIELIAKALDVPRSSLMPSALDGPPGSDVVAEGVLLVPVVRLFASPGGHLETGELIPVPNAVPDPHGGMLWTRVTGGGLPPTVATGAMVLLDPVRTPRHRDPIIIDYLGSTHAAWYLERDLRTDGGSSSPIVYRLGDGTTLEPAPDVRLAGVFVGAYVIPPRFPGI